MTYMLSMCRNRPVIVGIDSCNAKDKNKSAKKPPIFYIAPDRKNRNGPSVQSMANEPDSVFDLGIAWNWEYDADFIHGIEQACHHLGLTTYRIEQYNVKELTKKFRSGKIAFRTFLDRASDDDKNFQPLAELIAGSETHVFNTYEQTEYAKDKANMHVACLGEGIHVPYTIIISPYSKKKEVELSLTELAHLGRPFIIKPANTTGGGIGVVLGAETLKEIITSRKSHINDKYLLQETIHPVMLDTKRGWFRVFYAFGLTIPCWWNNETHIYHMLTDAEEKKFKLARLKQIAVIMQRICRLDFFSSEIALTPEGKFVAVDYVNEICDMRPQSKYFDGVPDKVIGIIQQQLAQRIYAITKKVS
jgi:hypothetical protein